MSKVILPKGFNIDELKKLQGVGKSIGIENSVDVEVKETTHKRIEKGWFM